MLCNFSHISSPSVSLENQGCYCFGPIFVEREIYIKSNYARAQYKNIFQKKYHNRTLFLYKVAVFLCLILKFFNYDV